MSDSISLIFYLTIYALSAILYARAVKKRSKLYLVLSLCAPILMAAYRYYVGTDFVTYLHRFQSVTSISLAGLFDLDMEPGFNIITLLSSKLGDEKVYFGLSAAFVVIPAVLFYRNNYSKYYCGLFYFLFLLGCFTTSLNIIRQGIAISFILCSSRYIFERKPWRFLLWVIIAMSFHFSAFVFLPAYLVYNRSNNFNFRQIALFAIAIVLILISTAILEYTSNFSLFDKYSGYAAGDSRANNRTFYFSLFVVIVFLLSAKRMQAIDNRIYTLLGFAILGLIIESTGFYSPFIKRSGMYYTTFNLITACIWIKSLSSKWRRIGYASVLFFYLAQFIVSLYVLKQSDIIPYNTIKTYNAEIYIE